MVSERQACQPVLVNKDGFNRGADFPYGCEIEHIHRAMTDFTRFLGFINVRLHTEKIERIETLLMPANFSSLVGEFMSVAIPKYCAGLVRNRYHNGHPDLIPKGRYPKDAVQHTADGIEIKASSHLSGWQGHNPEECWLMVFVYNANQRPTVRMDAADTAPRPFRFRMVLGARLEKEDWAFSGRSATSRRTITASVRESGRSKMLSNWIYRDS